jgi:hypothetical protein
MPARLRHRKAPGPERRRVDENGWVDFLQHRIRDADSGHLDPAAMHPARQQQVARLAAEKGHGFAGAHRHPHHRPAVAIDAARQIDGDHRRAACVDGLDDGPRCAFNRPVEPRPEQRIDDNIRAGKTRRGRGLDLAPPAAGGLGRVALHFVAFSEEQQPDRISAFCQQVRADKAVAAIIAGTCHDDDRRCTPRAAARYRVGHGSPGALHQTNARHPAGDRQAVGLGHFRGGHQLDHGAGDSTGGGRPEQCNHPLTADWAICLFSMQTPPAHGMVAAASLI